jgi:hypothetical protein
LVCATVQNVVLYLTHTHTHTHKYTHTQMCDLALLTVEDDTFLQGPGGSNNGTASPSSGPGPLRPLNFVDVPELQVPIAVAG